ncbi:MAG: CoA transferase, partial [Acetobacteraceae bacterium]|nr:CoA transferase [Acetobacteraceae bacterium]
MGPLTGLKVIEMAGIGPGPMCAMLLADLGAQVLRIDRVEPSGLGSPRPPRSNVLLRNREIIALDLKKPAAVELTLRLIEGADMLIEGFRPGVMERLGLGPDICLARNAKLIFGRVTGWGQEGPMAMAAGHDIDYIALTGALHAIGRAGQKPVPPLNLVGDYGGGALYLAFGIMAAWYEMQRSGKGQVVDTAMVDGAANLMASAFGALGGGVWNDEREANITDGGSPFYDVYECSDGKFLACGPIEAKFYAEFLSRIGFDVEKMPPQHDRKHWPETKSRIAAKLRTKTRDAWAALLETTDSCVAPVLTMTEAPNHPHNIARQAFLEIDGIVQPAPAPRFSRSVSPIPPPPSVPDPKRNAEILGAWLGGAEIAKLTAASV